MRKLSQAHLAERAGLKQSDISKIENGKISKTTAMARLSHVLRVPAAWLELNEGQEPDWSDDSEPPKASAEPGERDALLERMLIAYKAILPTDRANYVAQMERRAGEIREIEKRLRERAGHELLNPVVHQPAGSVGKKGKLS
jgi:transcriptional regulator with XRE-family HTH domain